VRVARAARARGARSAARSRRAGSGGPVCELLLARPRNAQLRREARASGAEESTRGQLTFVPSAPVSFSAGGAPEATGAAGERSTRSCLLPRQRRCCTPACAAWLSGRRTSFYGGLRSCATRRRERRTAGGDCVSPESHATNTAVRAPPAFPARRAAARAPLLPSSTPTTSQPPNGSHQADGSVRPRCAARARPAPPLTRAPPPPPAARAPAARPRASSWPPRRRASPPRPPAA